jgi:hypothetical protein
MNKVRGLYKTTLLFLNVLMMQISIKFLIYADKKLHTGVCCQGCCIASGV